LEKSYFDTLSFLSHSLQRLRRLRASEASREISILRPLLTFTRKQIEGHVFAWKVPYREDSTNSSVEYRRNSIRHEVFPLFERMNPSYVRTLNREMTYLSDASSIVEEWCKEHVKEVMAPMSFRPSDQLSFRPSEASGEISISITSLLEIPQWRYLLYYILEPYGFNSSVLESLENLLTSDRTISGKRFESDGYVLRTERQYLTVVPKMAGQAGHDAPVIPDLIGDPFIPIRIPGAYHINGQRIVVETLPWTPDMPMKQPADTLILDAGKLKFPFVCRVWRSGDWLIPLGMKGKKKLSDLFNDLKYSQFEKESSLVIVDCRGDLAEKQHVAAVLPVRIDDRYKVTYDTKEIISIRITDNR
jgi:tRNA(Ile)-lysidine synthase